MGIPDIREMTKGSNRIVVVEVIDTRNLGPTDLISSQGKRVAGQRSETSFRVEEVLTGDVDGGSIVVQYDSNPEFEGDPITPGFQAETRMMLFLRCAAQTCNFTKPETPGFSVARRSSLSPAPPQPDDVYLRVLQRLAAALFPDTDEKRRSGEFPEEVFVLSTEQSPYVSTIFHAALDESANAADTDLRGELIAALVRRGEASLLPELQQALFTGDLNAYSNMRENLILSLQKVDWHLSLPIAARALQLPSPTLRTVAARSIQNLHMENYTPHPNEMSVPATRVLLSALHDPDPGVAFAVMQSLGELNARHDERPTSTVPDAQWMVCLHFWDAFQSNLN
jgi:hypothetical protein